MSKERPLLEAKEMLDAMPRETVLELLTEKLDARDVARLMSRRIQ